MNEHTSTRRPAAGTGDIDTDAAPPPAVGRGAPRWWQRLVPATRRTRRRTVVAFGLAIASAALAGALPDAPVLTLGAILLGLWLGVTLRLAVEATADLPDEHLDERLVGERDSAYRTAYQVVATIFLLLAVGADIAADFVDVTPLLGALLPSVPVLCLFAPSAVLAWRREDVEVEP